MAHRSNDLASSPFWASVSSVSGLGGFGGPGQPVLQCFRALINILLTKVPPVALRLFFCSELITCPDFPSSGTHYPPAYFSPVRIAPSLEGQSAQDDPGTLGSCRIPHDTCPGPSLVLT